MTLSRIASIAAAVAAVSLLSTAGDRALGADEPLLLRSEMLTVDEVRPGMKGVGKSVFRGTKIEDFGITVLGVLRKVDFDGDIILIRIDSGPPVSQGFGVVSGMSGSPIYVNGKIIGALAYAWPFAKTPVAGVTPIAQMLEAFQPGSSPVRPQGTLRAAEPFLIDGRRIVRGVVAPSESVLPAAGQDTAALVPIATPVLVSGLSPRLIEDLRKAMAPLGLVPLAGGGSMGSIETRMEPGQAVGARLVGGDLDLTAVGTVTYVKDNIVLAFGHPMAGLGTTDVPLVAAYVHGVMPSSMISFKLASGGQTLGHFTQDRPWCVGGRLGGQAELIDGSLRITDTDRGVVRGYGVQVVRNRSITSMLLVAVLAGAIESVGPPAEGTTRVRFRFEAEGLPPMERENTYTVEGDGGILALLLGAFGGAESATGELSQILEVLQNSEFGEARLNRLGIEVELSKERRLARLEDVSIPTPRVRAGDDVDVVINLRASDGRAVQIRKTIAIPETCPPGRVRVGIAGGRTAERLRSRLEISDPPPVTMAQMVEQMLSRPSNDDLVIEVALRTVGIEARGYAFRDLPPAAIDLLRAATARKLRPLRDHVETRSKTEWVVSGSTVLSLTVEGKEKDKAGRPPSPEYEPPQYEQAGGGLAGLFSDLGYSVSGGARDLEAGEEEIDFGAPPPMPTWDEVETVGEREITAPSLSEKRPSPEAARGEAIGRVASIWRLGDPKELLEGEAEGTAILSSGGLALAPRAQELAHIEARCLWPVAVAPDGSVYAGSWTDGRLYRTRPDGETTCVLETMHAGIQAVAVAPDGTVYAAGVPEATIYRIKPGQEAEDLCHLSVQNVWALALDPSGDLWAATGTGGKLFRISPDGTAEVAFAAADRHITCLAVGADGTIYLGTSPLGKVYAVPPEGPPRSICEIDDAAVQSIGVDAAGSVYVGTSPKARVLKIERDGAVREVVKVEAKHSLALLARPDGTVLVATGPGAKVIAVYPDGSSSLLYHPKAAYIAGLAADPAGNVYLTAADTGWVIKLDANGARAGSYLSAVHDAQATARWGAVRWRGIVPEGGEVEICTRTGATAHPDETWSPWSPVPAGPGASVTSPAARFMQCRLDLAASGPAAPRLEVVEFTYLPANRGPEIKLASPGGGEIWSGTQTIRWSGRDPDRDELTYVVCWSADHGQTWTRIESIPQTEETPEEGQAEKDEAEAEGGAEEAGGASPGPAEVGEEEADAPLDDRVDPETPAAQSTRALRAAEGDLGDEGFEVSPEDVSQDEGPPEDMEEPGGEEPPAKTGPPSRATSLTWKTTDVPDGVYWLRIVASDEQANPADPRTAELISRSFVVDNTAPEVIIDLRREDDSPPPETVSVFDRATYSPSAEFRVDDGDWLAAVPEDGIFDGQYEALLLDRARLPEGSHEITLRARDAAGNVTSKTLRYLR